MKQTNLEAFTNLTKIEQRINDFAPAILTVWPDARKAWDEGQHLILKNNSKGIEFSVYFTMNYDSDYSKSAIFTKDDKYNNLSKIKNSSLIGVFSDNNLRLYDKKMNLKAGISINKHTFMLNGQFMQYAKFSKYAGRDDLTTFKYTSLVKQCAAKTCAKGGRNGKGFAKGQRNMKKVTMGFDHSNGKAYTEDVKSMTDAYYIVKKAGYAESYMNFTRKVNKGGFVYKAGSYDVYIDVVISNSIDSIYNNDNNNDIKESTGSIELEITTDKTEGAENDRQTAVGGLLSGEEQMEWPENIPESRKKREKTRFRANQRTIFEIWRSSQSS